MKKIIFGLSVAVLLAACDIRRSDKVADDSVSLPRSSAGPAPAAATDTTMVQLIDSVFNFGKIAEGEKVTFNFRFKNVGVKPLIIASTAASCGCTVPEKPEKPVLPGETGFIKVVFNSQGKLGHNEKNITIVANTYPAFPQLLLRGDVLEAK